MKELQELGLSEQEAKIYVTLLKLGSSSAYKVSKEASLYKANTYETLKNLEKKGLVSKFTKDKATLYQIDDVSNLYNLVRSKEEIITQILPKLTVLQGMANKNSEASIHVGIKAYLNLMYERLEYNQTIYAYGIPKEGYSALSDKLVAFHNKRIEKKIKMFQFLQFAAANCS